MMKLKEVGDIAKESYREWSADRASRLAAALAFYTLFAAAPLLLVLIAIVGLVLGRAAAQGSLMHQIGVATGPDAARALQAMIADAAGRPAGTVVALVISGAVTLVVAIGLFIQVQDALNTVWHVQPKRGRGLWGLLRPRLVALAVLGLSAVILLASVVVGPLVTAFAKLVPILGHSTAVMQILELLLFWAVITVLFAVIFKVLPDARIDWGDVWLGAFATAFLFIVGKFLLSLYFGLAHVGSTYGAASGLVVLLLWVYYSAQIFLYGAEFTKLHAARHGKAIEPAEYAGKGIPEGPGPGPEQQQAA